MQDAQTNVLISMRGNNGTGSVENAVKTMLECLQRRKERTDVKMKDWQIMVAAVLSIASLFFVDNIIAIITYKLFGDKADQKRVDTIVAVAGALLGLFVGATIANAARDTKMESLENENTYLYEQIDDLKDRLHEAERYIEDLEYELDG